MMGHLRKIWKKFGDNLTKYAKAMIEFTASDQFDVFVKEVAKLAGYIANIIESIYNFLQDDRSFIDKVFNRNPVSKVAAAAADESIGKTVADEGIQTKLDFGANAMSKTVQDALANSGL